MSLRHVIVLLLVSFSVNISSFAATPPLDQEQKVLKGKPPQLAIDICKGKTNDFSCSFIGPRGEESGRCEYTPDKQYFACNPNRIQNNAQRNKADEQTSRITQYPSHLSTLRE